LGHMDDDGCCTRELYGLTHSFCSLCHQERHGPTGPLCGSGIRNVRPAVRNVMARQAPFVALVSGMLGLPSGTLMARPSFLYPSGSLWPTHFLCGSAYA
jgi:hypothetical protein